MERISIRQPAFYVMAVFAGALLILTIFVSYFTFGEDYKMMKQIGFDVIMLASALFGLFR